MALELLIFSTVINWDVMKRVGKTLFYAKALLRKQFGESDNYGGIRVD